MQAWKTTHRRGVLDCGHYLKVELHTVELPDGRVIADWPWLITPDFVIVLPETEDGRFLLFRQTKYAIDGVTLAPLGGYVDPGEVPANAARRELEEELGYAAPEWHNLGTYVVDANRGAGKAHLFLARGAYPAGKRRSDDLEEQEQVSLTRADLETALTHGAFSVLPWAAAIALALRQLRELDQRPHFESKPVT